MILVQVASFENSTNGVRGHDEDMGLTLQLEYFFTLSVNMAE